MLCMNCRNWASSHKLHFQPQETSSRSCQGCRLVDEAVHSLPATASRPPRDIDDAIGYLWEIEKDNTNRHLLKINYTEGDEFLIFGVKGQLNPWGLDATAKEIPTTTSSPEAMRRVLRWIDQCDENHDECKVDTVPKLPDRYLDLGADFDGPVKLKESSGETGSYICLSYSWGKESFLRTMSENFGDHQRGIPLQRLPQLFRDLVTIARTLKIRYMWIDALCIIQQDPKDWEEQSVGMLSVYRNAYLTVASVSTTTPNDSCFFTTEAITRVGPIDVSAISHFHRRTRNDEAKFPMLLRAWTYQERHISQRVIYFGSQELIWDCFHHRTCCCERPIYWADVVEKKDFHQVIIQPKLSENIQWRQESLWRKMVIQYSQLHLTLRSDKLRALDGLADVFQLATKNTYVAGLWRETLPIDLCWISNYPSSKGYSSSYLAPSWSWASITGGVIYEGDFYEFNKPPDDIKVCATILNVACKAMLLDNPPRHTGFVELHAHLLTSDLISQRDSEFVSGNRQFRASFFPDQGKELNGSDPRVYIPLVIRPYWISGELTASGLLLAKEDGFHRMPHFKRIALMKVRISGSLCSEWLEDAGRTTIRII